MKLTNDLTKLHEEMIQYVTEENNREMAASIAEKSAAARAAEKLPDDKSALESLGVNITKLDALEREENEISDGELETTIEKMDELSQEPIEVDNGLDVESALLPADTFRLEPVWSAEFTDNDQQDRLIDASSISTQALGTKNRRVRAWGGGWGCVGGVGSITSNVEFGFWFRPRASKFYSIRPHFRLRGYYIVRANDRWYNCKHTKVKVSVQTNVYQYNWKGWNSADVLYVNNQNINRNRRADLDRHTYNSYLLAGGDWAWIRARIRLHARAQGGGSYAELNFASGNANYLGVPHIHVW